MGLHLIYGRWGLYHVNKFGDLGCFIPLFGLLLATRAGKWQYGFLGMAILYGRRNGEQVIGLGFRTIGHFYFDACCLNLAIGTMLFGGIFGFFGCGTFGL